MTILSARDNENVIDYKSDSRQARTRGGPKRYNIRGGIRSRGGRTN